MNLNGTSNMSKMPPGKRPRIEAPRDAPKLADQRGAALCLPIGQLSPYPARLNHQEISILPKFHLAYR